MRKRELGRISIEIGVRDAELKADVSVESNRRRKNLKVQGFTQREEKNWKERRVYLTSFIRPLCHVRN